MKTVMGKNKWCATVIEKMLSNEKYLGAALLQKTYTVDYLTKQRSKNNGELSKYFIKNIVTTPTQGSHKVYKPLNHYPYVMKMGFSRLLARRKS